MSELFNYTTFSTRLEKATRSMVISFYAHSKYVNQEMLFELESVFNWCLTKVEIYNLVIESQNPHFSLGLDPEKLINYSSSTVEKLFQRLHKINQAMMQLPQTVVLDLGDGAHNIGIELSLGADIRLAHQGATLHWNHQLIGLVAAGGGLSILPHTLNFQTARFWLNTSANVSAQEAHQRGFIHSLYDSTNRYDLRHQLLAHIKDQAPIQRIQTKLALWECLRPQLEQSHSMERKIAKAAFVSEDWKTKKMTDFMPAKHMAYAVKLSLVKDQDHLTDQENLHQ